MLRAETPMLLLGTHTPHTGGIAQHPRMRDAYPMTGASHTASAWSVLALN